MNERIARAAIVLCMGVSGGCQDGGTSAGRVVAVPDSIIVKRGADETEARTERARIKLVNRSKTPVSIKDLASSCSCTIVLLPAQQTIAPGAEVELTVEAELPQFGRQSSYVTVATDSLETPIVTIRMDLIGRTIPHPVILSAPRDITIRLPVESDVASMFEIHTLEASNSPSWVSGIAASVAWIQVSQVSREVVHRRSEEVDEVKYVFAMTWSEEPAAGSSLTAVLKPVLLSEALTPGGEIGLTLIRPEMVTAVPRELVLSGADAEAVLTLFAESLNENEWECRLKSAPPGVEVARDDNGGSPFPSGRRFIVKRTPLRNAEADGEAGVLVFEAVVGDVVELRIPCVVSP